VEIAKDPIFGEIDELSYSGGWKKVLADADAKAAAFTSDKCRVWMLLYVCEFQTLDIVTFRALPKISATQIPLFRKNARTSTTPTIPPIQDEMIKRLDCCIARSP
jgi:hypothetical protein